MHSLIGWRKWMVVLSLVGSVQGAAVPAPIITPAPQPGLEVFIKRQEPDAASFAQVLLTAIPLSLRQIAATNAPAVSSILWAEFLDDKKPQWFLELPWDIQNYLTREFGPKTAWYTAPPQTTRAQITTTASGWQWSISSNPWRTSQATPSASIPNGVIGSSAVSSSRSSSAIVSPPTRTPPQSSNRISMTSRVASSRSTNASSTLGASATAEPISPPTSSDGLTRRQKLGLGVGVPFGMFGAAALLLGCCFLLRRRKRKQVDGSEPPSSPGFIPRFAFQDKSTDNLEHRRPLNPTLNPARRDHRDFNWEDDGYDPYEPASFAPVPMSTPHKENTFYATGAPAPASMIMHDPKPIMAPALYHTHSSNRARGRRTSYSSLHSVTETSELGEEPESPVLGRQPHPIQSKRKSSLPMVLEIPYVPNAATIKRKPIPESPKGISPAAVVASQFLLRPPIKPTDHSGSSSSGLALSTNSSFGAEYQTETTSPISPLSQHAATNPFSNDYSYVEDYGPEYQSGYLDHEDGLYGGNRSLHKYPDPSPPRRNSKSEWPLRNISMGPRRNKSTMWERVYER
ncbi:hypothetical protein GQ44DRAFT_823320 [Phaeosphaeriaceae sp. PMI808]|nr:hypothetical protein GQ44DRAFT_823320 [Phaeosphaeriaceae sp. PMI808]